MKNDCPIFTFNYNQELTRSLRNAINEKQFLTIKVQRSSSRKTRGKTESFSFYAWDKMCAIMDRLDDTVEYVNGMRLGDCHSSRSAFDFFDFINCSYIIIDCIREIAKIFGSSCYKNIGKTREFFGNPCNADDSDINNNDNNFFEYIRSLCVVHPLKTNNDEYDLYMQGTKIHCSPFVVWRVKHQFFLSDCDGDLIAVIYSSNDTPPKYLSLYVYQFEQYLGAWLNLIPTIIADIHHYTDSKIEQFRHIPVKQISEFENPVTFIKYLKQVYSERFDDGQNFIFDYYIYLFDYHFSVYDNERKLQKLKNAISFSLGFLRNALQNMTFEGKENNGISDEYSEDLFSLLWHPLSHPTQLKVDSYTLEKIAHLSPLSCYGVADKLFARRLMITSLDEFSKYVVITGNESDSDLYILCHLARYLDGLENPTELNRSIPNETEYRVHLVPDDEYRELTSPEVFASLSDLSVEDVSVVFDDIFDDYLN